MGFISRLFGSAPRAQAQPVAVAPIKEEVEDQSKATRSQRAALYSTEGGASGEELDPTQVRRRSTIFGN